MAATYTYILIIDAPNDQGGTMEVKMNVATLQAAINAVETKYGAVMIHGIALQSPHPISVESTN